MAIRSKNLNLLPILQALLKEESVIRAADSVGLSQPAMSGSLARLRELLRDPILVRVGRTMRLTPRAQRMRKQLDELCGQIEQLLEAEHFDPLSADMLFRIAAPDYIAFLISDTLLGRLAQEAPKVRLQFVDVPRDLVHRMDEGLVDLAVCGSFGLWPDLLHEFMFRENYIAAIACDHPFSGRSHVTAEELKSFPSPTLDFDAGQKAPPKGRNWTTGLPTLDYLAQISTMSQFVGLLLAAKSPNVVRAPVSLVQRLVDVLPLHTVEISDEVTDFDTCMFWTAVVDGAVEHQWLRRIVRESLAPYGGATLMRENMRMPAVAQSTA